MYRRRDNYRKIYMFALHRAKYVRRSIPMHGPILIVLIILLIFVVVVYAYEQRCGEAYVNGERLITFHHTKKCQYCQVMRPVWERVRREYSNSGLKFAEVDEDNVKNPLFTRVPVIRMINEHGETSVYAGTANYETLRNWIIAPTPSSRSPA
jgi:thiol-disulfide isomerase/thioredoxin